MFNQDKLNRFLVEHKIVEIPVWEIYPPRGNYYHNSQVVVNEVPVKFVLLGDELTRDFQIGAYFAGQGNYLNRSTHGCTLENLCVRFDADCLQLKPEKALVCIGLNDITAFVKKHEDGKMCEADKLAFLGKMREKYRLLCKRAKAVNQTLYFASLFPVAEEDARKELVTRLNGVISAVCDEFDTLFIDLYSALISTDNGALDFNGVYPNVKTYNVLYQELCNALEIPAVEYKVDETEYQKFFEENYPDGYLFLKNETRRAEFNRKNMQIVLNHMPVDIVFIGDSITEQYATDVYFGEYGRIINRGYGGERMQELVKRFESDALALKPRLVILASGINDTIPFYQKFKNGEEITETDKHKYLVETRIAYRQALEKAREAGIPLWIATILPLGTKDFRTDFLMANNEQIKKLCKEYDTVCLDYHAQTIQDDGRTFIKDMHFGDDLHPHVKGYNVLSGIAKEQLKKENF